MKTIDLKAIDLKAIGTLLLFDLPAINHIGLGSLPNAYPQSLPPIAVKLEDTKRT